MGELKQRGEMAATNECYSSRGELGEDSHKCIYDAFVFVLCLLSVIVEDFEFVIIFF